MNDMKWIPVTERLPEVSGRYLVIEKQTFHHESTLFVDLLFFIDGKHDPWDTEKEISNRGNFRKLPDGFIGWAFQDDNYYRYRTLLDIDEFNREEVIAWMPLPEIV